MEQDSGVLEFWAHRFKRPRDVLFIVGRGFDPRMCFGTKAVLSAGGEGRRDVMAIEFDEGIESPSQEHIGLVDANWNELVATIGSRGDVGTKSLKMWSEDGRRVSTRSAWGLFNSSEEFETYSDLVVDISALPRGVYIPLLAKLMHLLDAQDSPRTNLHVLVAENPRMDAAIQDEGVDDNATYLYPAGGIERFATVNQPKIWVPVLGEAQSTQLRRIYDLVLPDEIAPVLPSPSVNPRRADNLLLEYRTLLFDVLRIEPSNFIFAAERNPFEAYRQIGKAILHYRNALDPLGGCKAVVSALSSKLLSVGSLLAAYELKHHDVMVGLAHVECQGYSLTGEPSESVTEASVLFELWICGECYEA